MIPVASRGRQSRPRLEADVLLLVEGQDEVNLFQTLVKQCLEDETQAVQVLEVGGKDQFKKRFALIMSDAQTRPTLRSIGVVRDADDNAQGSFQSVRDSIQRMARSTLCWASILACGRFTPPPWRRRNRALLLRRTGGPIVRHP